MYFTYIAHIPATHTHTSKPGAGLHLNGDTNYAHSSIQVFILHRSFPVELAFT